MMPLRLLPLLILLLMPFASPALPTDDEPMEPVAAFGNLPETETAGMVLPVKTLPPEELTVSFDEFYELTSATGEERDAKARALIAERWGSESILNADVEAGDPSALLMVALVTDDAGDASRGLDKLDLAARNGHPYAQYIVGSRKVASKQPAIRREGLELLDLAGAAGYHQPLYAACRARLYGERDLRDPNRAIADLWRARQLGSGPACRSLGYLFNTGLHVKKDVPRSVALYEEASNRGDVKGRQYFAACLRDGEGVAPQPERAFELFKLNDAAGHAEAGYSLFLWYSEGDFAEKNLELAAYYLRRAAAGGYEYAESLLAYYQVNGELRPHLPQDIPTGLAQLEALVQKEHPDAMRRLGILYELGEFVPKDGARALQLHKKSAQLGNGYAPFNAAQIMLEGDPEEKVISDAVALLYLGMTRGDNRCAGQLGDLLRTGQFPNVVPKDEKAAVKYYRRGMQSGNQDSKLLYGYCLIEGVGIEADPREGLRILKEVAEKGNGLACHRVSVYYNQGSHGVTKDRAMAINWLEKGVRLGEVRCFIDLALILEGDPARREESVRLMQSAANKGDKFAIDYLKKKAGQAAAGS